MENRLKKDRVWIKGQTLTNAQLAEKRENTIIGLTVGFMGSLVGFYVLKTCRDMLFPRLPESIHSTMNILLYWLIAIIPVMVMRQDGTKLKDIGLWRKGLIRQILTGLGLGVGCSLVLTGLPHLLGLGRFVIKDHLCTTAAEFALEFAYCIIGVAAADELVFRGMIYDKLKSLFGRELYAAIGSSILYGLLHIFSGSIMQVLTSVVIGFILCIFKSRIKDCSLVTLILCHGLYEGLISVWTFIMINR
ncbi:CPBP family intramembrane glutamic endopeptidase [Ruminococcus sp.]|uniref:CPBP family intramembrane glutamic endopeptidase n=1 Tax=Ruminococcus sp. TaxID=41978 RepID=UPI0025EC20B9|nr:CPBP family intramembrane glutamic endopeptidase [Ruminococcus sp.]MBQ8967127.1 CPBP family intramembrane metalloprotease [Ruminococcus sp.]